MQRNSAKSQKSMMLSLAMAQGKSAKDNLKNRNNLNNQNYQSIHYHKKRPKSRFLWYYPHVKH